MFFVERDAQDLPVALDRLRPAGHDCHHRNRCANETHAFRQRTDRTVRLLCNSRR